MTTSQAVVVAIRARSIQVALSIAFLLASASTACQSADEQRTFATAEEAVEALKKAAKAGNKTGSTDEMLAIFGVEAKDIISSADPVTAKRNREVFLLAVAQQWQLIDVGNDRKELEIGYEAWPFPIPLVKGDNGWRYDTEAGKDEILTRRIGRNELATLGICRTYVRAQEVYASQGRDGKPAGLFAQKFASDPGLHNGLYWPPAPRERASPLGVLVAQASDDGYQRNKEGQTPFHGYYFRILTAQGEAAAGGAKDYLANGELSHGFGLVAWPAQYDVTGVMTFIVNQEGIVYQKDLGPTTEDEAKAIKTYNPDDTWEIAD